MAKTKIRLEVVSRGMEQMLKSQEMVYHLGGLAADLRDRCGRGYESEAQVGRQKALSMVWPATYEAKVENARRQVMLKAVGRRI